jgi:serine/threonine protein kinase
MLASNACARVSSPAHMNDDKHDPRLGQTVGNVRLERVLGAGGFGVVYAGTHELTGRRVAVKMLHSHLVGHSEIRERFLREARTAAALEHPNVVDVLDMGQSDDGAFYLVMEFLTGEPFDVRLSRSALSPREAIGLLLPVMDALACTHELRHRAPRS